nr:deaminase domain-containing protein [Pseudomonas fluorescens]
MRRELPEQGNAAFAEIKIDSLSTEPMVFKAYSKYNDREGSYLPKPPGDVDTWVLKPQVASRKYVNSPEGYMRDMDTEFKILETVMQRLGDNKGAVGRIDLICEKAVCPNCTDVITQFHDRYPKIQLNVFTAEN